MIGCNVEVEELRVDGSMDKLSLFVVRKTEYMDADAGKWVDVVEG